MKYPDRDPKKDEGRNWCGSLSRGYRAIYEISDGRLYLKEIYGPGCRNDGISRMCTVAPGRKRLALDWYSGLLLSFYGNTGDANPYSLAYLDGDAFEKFSLFEVVAGAVTEVRHYDRKSYLDFKKRQYESYKQTPEFETALKRRLHKDGSNKAEVLENLEGFVLWSTKKFLVK